MAEIDMQKKRGGGAGWIGWVVGLLVLILLVWWIWPDAETDDFAVVDTAEVVEPAAEIPTPTTPDIQAFPTSAILTDPGSYMGQSVSGLAEVVEVPTDRGFWLDAGNGERLLVVLDDTGEEVPVHVQQGQRVMITDAMVHGADQIDQVSGNLDEATRTMLQNQQVFLTVTDTNITMQPMTGDGMDTQTEAATGDTGGY